MIKKLVEILQKIFCSQRQKKIIEALKDEDSGSDTMRVVGRGTLVMDAISARNSKKYKELLSKSHLITENESHEYKPETHSHPSETLRDVLKEKNMTWIDLAAKTKIPLTIINKIAKGKLGIDSETARKLEDLLDIRAEFWIERQGLYDKSKIKTVSHHHE